MFTSYEVTNQINFLSELISLHPLLLDHHFLHTTIHVYLVLYKKASRHSAWMAFEGHLKVSIIVDIT